MKKAIYLSLSAMLLLGVAACQPNLPAGTIVAVPSPPPLPPPPPPPPATYAAPAPYYAIPEPGVRPGPRYNYYVKGPRGNWAQKRCPIGMHWQSSRRVMVKTESGASASRVIPARCVRT